MPLVAIATSKLYEANQYISVTNHGRAAYRQELPSEPPGIIHHIAIHTNKSQPE